MRCSTGNLALEKQKWGGLRWMLSKRLMDLSCNLLDRLLDPGLWKGRRRGLQGVVRSK